MPIESATYVNELNQAYPAATDGVKEGDDHIRLVKKVLLDTFPNLNAAVTKTAAELNAVPREMPIGGIIMWSGSLASIPTNWALCDGQTVTRTDGGGSLVTPNLLNRLIGGAGDGLNTGDRPAKYAVGATGGADSVVLTTPQLPAHSHTITATGTTESAGAHTHTITDPGHKHTYQKMTNQPIGGSGGAYNGITYATDDTSTATTGITIASGGAHTHAVTLTASAANTGAGEAHENRPPYYALAYIMRY